MGIIMDPKTRQQKHYGGCQVEMTRKHAPGTDQLNCHRDDILCLGINDDRTRVVTGQVGPYPSVHVWNSETGDKIKAFQLDKDSKGVSACGLSKCGKYVAVVDMAEPARKLHIYNIERDCFVLQMEAGKSEYRHLEWSKR